MIITVVVAFLTCWAPFHARRLLTIYNKHWTPLLLNIQSALFYLSGRSMVRRTTIPVKELVMRSDTIQTQFSLSLNGNTEFEGVDPAREQILVVNTPLDTPSEPVDHRELRKSWAATCHKAAYCSVCAVDTSDPFSVKYCDSDDLLNHSISVDSAC